MLIYKVPNCLKSNFNFICDSQATIDARPKDPVTDTYYVSADLCSIGGESEANTVLADNQIAWLAFRADQFNVNLQTAVEGGVKWAIVDLATEPANTDRQYFVFDSTTGLYTETAGLDAAQALLTQMQQKHLVLTKMDTYTTTTSWE
jgi:hypothetical protein